MSLAPVSRFGIRSAGAPRAHDLGPHRRDVAGGRADRIVLVAADIIGARYAAVGVLGPDGRLLERFITYGIDDATRARIGPPPRGHGILGLVIREARPIRLPDLARHPDSYGFPPHHPPMHSFLGVPIVGRRGAFGNLYLTEKLGRRGVQRGGRAHRRPARRDGGGRGGERPAARGERPAPGGGAAAAPHPGAVLRDGEPRAPELARGGVRLGGDAGAEEGPGDGTPRGLRGARLGSAGHRSDQRSARPEPAGRGPAQAGDPGGGSRRRRAQGLEPHDAHRRGKGALQLEVDADLPACNTDASRVEQILVNLWATPSSTAPRAGPCGCRSRPGMDW